MIQQSHYWVYPEKIYAPLFIAVVFTTAKTWKPLKYLLTSNWRRKMWCICMYVGVCVYIYIYMHAYIQWNIIQTQKIMQ